MSASEQEIRVGQIWERKKDGTRVRVTGYHSSWDDVRWRAVEGGRRGAIYGCYLRERYVLLEDADA